MSEAVKKEPDIRIDIAKIPEHTAHHLFAVTAAHFKAFITKPENVEMLNTAIAKKKAKA